MNRGRARALIEIKDDHLFCRMMGNHTYERFYPAEELIPQGAYTHLAWRCIHCTMFRIDALDKNYEVFRRKYLAPEGYYMKRSELPAKRDLRREYIRRSG